jgi:HD superfamily phosphohydrolase
MTPKAGRIKDSVHGYVVFTRIEREFLDDPLTQRLRWISQSGLAHYVFPEVRTSRFAHSLGAMHLSSRFLAGALRNTSPEILEPLEVAIKEAVEEATDGFLPSDLRDVVRLLTADGLLGGRAVSTEAEPYVLLVEQGLRLAALFHDIGHLPFSHDFEYALGRIFDERTDIALERFGALYREPEERSGQAIHELIGYQLAEALFHKLHDNVFLGTELDALSRCVVQIAEQVLMNEAPKPEVALTPANAIGPTTVWWLLHSLMAGELDVDRCDYLLRDARAYGFEFVSYDLDRLVDHLVVLRPRTDRGLLDVGVRPQGVAAAESLLIARYRAYQWGPFHHKVAQLGAALQHTIRAVVRESVETPAAYPELNKFLDSLQAIAGGDRRRLHREAADVLEAFVEYDDVWWLTVLRERLREHGDDAWLRLVCRRTRGPVSLWKRPDQFPGDLEAFNDRLPKREDAAGTRSWNAAVDVLAPEVLIARHSFTPWKYGQDGASSALSVLSAEGSIIPLTDLAHITASLRGAWRRDVQVQAFSADSADPAQTVEHLNEALPPNEPPA